VSGKGSARRPAAVSRAELDAAWERTFGCATCEGRRYVGDLYDHGPTGLLPAPCPECSPDDPAPLEAISDTAREAIMASIQAHVRLDQARLAILARIQGVRPSVSGNVLVARLRDGSPRSVFRAAERAPADPDNGGEVVG
jgi:hypothetical protein